MYNFTPTPCPPDLIFCQHFLFFGLLPNILFSSFNSTPCHFQQTQDVLGADNGRIQIIHSFPLTLTVSPCFFSPCLFASSPHTSPTPLSSSLLVLTFFRHFPPQPNFLPESPCLLLSSPHRPCHCSLPSPLPFSP